jgi:phage terminase large subunit
MEKLIDCTEVYEKTVNASKDYKIICHQGGSRSSKTWSIFQFLLGKAIAGEGITVTIVRDKMTWIKSTLLLDFKKIINLMELPISPDINVNRAEQVYNVNGSEFAFYGLDYSEKLHGRTQDWFWINEAMEVGKKHFDQLEMRTSVGGILDYNPYDDLHWVFDLPKRPDVIVIKSTQLDNPFLPQTMRDKILSYKPTPENIANGTADNYMWQVYGLGNKARLKGTVFDNWDVVEDIPEQAKFIAYGKDFGYTNDPTTLIALYMMDNEIYLDQVLYKTGMTNQDIVVRYEELQINKRDEIYADSSEPKSIEEIRRQGYNIRGAKKGADSIMYGIDLLKQYKIHITKRSTELENELRKYKFQEDKVGNVINKPVDVFNHCIDAVRYVAIMKLGRRTQIQTFDRDRLGI